MGRTIGIDLGTTNSVVACVENQRVEAILNPEGAKTTPSTVLFGNGEIVVGELAKRQAVTSAGLVVRSAKRLMGRRFAEVADYADELPFKAIEGRDGRAEIELSDGRIIPPELVAAEVLKKMKHIAEDYFGDEIDGAVITVPAYFNDAQRTATKRAAEIAELEVLRIINEPTAAALAYGMGREQRNQIVAVFDFGGGTFDISILQISGDIFEVLATNGDTNLGGDNIDQKLFQEICDAILQQTGIDPTSDLKTVSRIREAAEKAKIELSSLASTQISLPFIVADSSGPRHYEAEISRAQFNEWMAPIFERLLGPCAEAIADANVTVEQIDEVILVGGSTRIPRVQEMVRDFFRREPNRSVNPDEAVALGAAIQAGVMRGDLAEVLLLDVTPLSLGIELAGGVFRPLISRNSSIPCEATRKFTTVVDNQTTVLVHVLQGERAKASENRTLAMFRLTGLPPMPKELAEIEVTFRIDADGILEVSAVDLTTGVSTGIQVEGYGDFAQMAPEEIQRIIAEAEGHAGEDRDFVQSAGRRAQADRVQQRIEAVLAAGAEVITEQDLKRIKETMLRLDLAIAAKEWVIADMHEQVLVEMLERYEDQFDLHATLNKQFELPQSSREDVAIIPSTMVSDDDVKAPPQDSLHAPAGAALPPSAAAASATRSSAAVPEPEPEPETPATTPAAAERPRLAPPPAVAKRLAVKDGVVDVEAKDLADPRLLPPPPPA
jgi:molecular chaperone DnaK